IALARILLGPRATVQAPPNLSDERFPELLDAGINDWGGVSPVTIDHVNPEKPWPQIERLRAETEARGSTLRERLTIYPMYAAQPVALFEAEGDALEHLCRIADDMRRDAVGDVVTYVINRNINFTNICYVGCRFCAFAQRRDDADAYFLSNDEVAARAQEAWDWGATEVCIQGGIHPDLPGDYYFDLLRAIKARVPGMHIHAFSPMEVLNGAARLGISFTEWLAEAKRAGLGSTPGTAAEILDDDVRWVLTK